MKVPKYIVERSKHSDGSPKHRVYKDGTCIGYTIRGWHTTTGKVCAYRGPIRIGVYDSEAEAVEGIKAAA
jgi:hypothetical protein